MRKTILTEGRWHRAMTIGMMRDKGWVYMDMEDEFVRSHAGMDIVKLTFEKDDENETHRERIRR